MTEIAVTNSRFAQPTRRAFGAALALGFALPVALSLPRGARAAEAQITGAGGTFPAPVYAKWGAEGGKALGLELNYQAIGSGGGQNQIRNRTVDFGASDAPMSADALKQANLLQIPTVMGSIVMTVNIPGVGMDELKLTGEIVADIYAGKITKWNDKQITELNSGVKLPNLAIAPVYRADASGTSYVFTSYLSAVSADWKSNIGFGTSVKWSAGTGARGNDGVAGTVHNIRGGIGYVEYAYAAQNHLTTTQLRNKAGHFVKPTMASFAAASSAADWSVPDFAASLIDTAGADAWPIVTPTFLLLPKDPKDATRMTNVLRFIDWCYAHGGETAQQLDYIPLPGKVQDAVRAAWSEIKGPDGKALWPAK